MNSLIKFGVYSILFSILHIIVKGKRNQPKPVVDMLCCHLDVSTLICLRYRLWGDFVTTLRCTQTRKLNYIWQSSLYPYQALCVPTVVCTQPPAQVVSICSCTTSDAIHVVMLLFSWYATMYHFKNQKRCILRRDLVHSVKIVEHAQLFPSCIRCTVTRRP